MDETLTEILEGGAKFNQAHQRGELEIALRKVDQNYALTIAETRLIVRRYRDVWDHYLRSQQIAKFPLRKIREEIAKLHASPSKKRDTRYALEDIIKKSALDHMGVADMRALVKVCEERGLI